MIFFVRFLFLVFLGAFFSLTGPAVGQERVTPETATSEFMDTAPDGAVFILAPGTYSEPFFVEGKRIELRGEEGATLLAQGESLAIAVLEGAELTLSGVTIEGNVDGYPMVMVVGSSLYMRDVHVSHPDGDVLFATQGASLNIDDSHLESETGAALIVTAGSSAEVAGSTVISASGPAIIADGAGQVSLAAMRVQGEPALDASGVAVLGIEQSTLHGTGPRAPAIIVNDTDQGVLLGSTVTGGMVALRAKLSENQLFTVENTLLASGADGAADADGAIGAEFRVTNSILLANNPGGDRPFYGFLSEGAEFIPVFDRSAILAPGGYGGVAQDGAGLSFGKGAILGDLAPLLMLEGSDDLTLIEDTSLLPPMPIEGNIALDQVTQGRLLAPEAEARAELDGLIAALSQATSGPVAEPVDLVEAVQTLDAVAGLLDNGSAEPATLEVLGRDLSGKLHAVPFSYFAEELIPSNGSPISLLHPGPGQVIIAASGLERVQDVVLEPGLNRIEVDLGDTLVLDMHQTDDDEPDQMILQLLPQDQRAEKLGLISLTSVRGFPARPRYDVIADDVASAVLVARDFLANLKTRSAEAGFAEGSDQEQAFKRSARFAQQILALYGTAEDAPLLATADLAGDSAIGPMGRYAQTAMLEARLGTLATGVLADQLRSGSEVERIEAAAVLYSNGLDIGVPVAAQVFAEFAARSGQADPQVQDGQAKALDIAGSFLEMMDVADPSFMAAAQSLLMRAQGLPIGELQYGEMGIPLAYILAHGTQDQIAKALDGQGTVLWSDVGIFVPILTDLTSILRAARKGYVRWPMEIALALLRHVPDAERRALVEDIDNTVWAGAVAQQGGGELNFNQSLAAQGSFVSFKLRTAAERVSDEAAGIQAGARGYSYNGSPTPPMAQPWRVDEALSGLSRANDDGMFYVRTLDYLPVDQLRGLLDGADLSAWPDPDLTRLALLTLSRSHGTKDDEQSGLVTPFPDDRLRLPFLLKDDPAGEEGVYSGAMNGILNMTPRLTDDVLTLDVFLESASHYLERCGLAAHIETGGCGLEHWRNHAYVDRNAERLVGDMALVRLGPGGITDRVPFDVDILRNSQRRTARLPGRDLAGWALSVQLNYGPKTQTHWVVPLWNTFFAASERERNAILDAARAAIAASPNDASLVLALADRQAELGQLQDAAATLASYGAKIGDPIDGVLRGAEVYLNAKQPKAAYDLIDAAIDPANPNLDLLFAATVTALDARSYFDAYEKALAMNLPGDAEVLALQGKAALLAGDFFAAVDALSAIPQDQRDAELRVLYQLALQLNSGTGDGAQFVADIFSLAANRGDGPGLAGIWETQLLSPVEGEVPAQCDAAAYAGMWLRTTEHADASESYIEAARGLCPSDGSMADHIAG